MGRGTDLAEGYSVTERGPTGVDTTFTWQGGTLVVKRSQDFTADLEEVARMRERNTFRGFAEDKELGRIPELFYADIRGIKDTDERKKAVRAFFREHPEFCAYQPLLTG